MGGAAFTSGPDPLNTPRMPPHMYIRMRDECQFKLKTLFHRVHTPIEGPGKPDFGDVDLMVANDKVPGRSVQDALREVKEALGAEREKNDKKTQSFAVPWPHDENESTIKGVNGEGDDSEASTIIPGTTGEVAGTSSDTSGGLSATSEINESASTPPKRYVQVDVRICGSEQELEWMLFKHAHGDIWSLLGTIIRPFGLTIDETALWLRIPEIEAANRNLAKVRLTDDRHEVLEFLGMKEVGYWEKPFDDWRGLFEYTASCRLFWVRSAEEHDAETVAWKARVQTMEVEKSGDDGPNVQKPKAQEGGREGGPTTRDNGLTTRDRKKLKQRPLFSKWHDEFVPQCREEGRFSAPEPGMTIQHMRNIVRDEAFARFPGIKDAYEERLIAWQREKRKEDVVRAIKESVPKAVVPNTTEEINVMHRQVLISALKKAILLGDAVHGVALPTECKDAAEPTILDVEKVRDWVAQNWQTIEPIAWEKQMQVSKKNMAIKERKHLAEEEEAARAAAKKRGDDENTQSSEMT
jgi:hypothetical protein